MLSYGIGGDWTDWVCQGMTGGIGNGEALGKDVAVGAHEAGFTAGATCTGGAHCNAGAACCIGTAGAGKLGGLSKLAWHDADAAIVSIAGGIVKTGGLDDAGVLAILAGLLRLTCLTGWGQSWFQGSAWESLLERHSSMSGGCARLPT